MSAVLAAARPWRFAGVPLAAWTYALRNWATMMVALYVAFWLQLDGASSAGTCVAILSLQTRGQAFQKAAYRLLGTAIGVVASLAIAGALGQTRELFFLACCLWFGLCATLAGLFDGNRAYGAILSGYTVAIVALPNVDAPLSTFSSGINQGAAITIGILAVAVVGDLSFAPDLFPAVLKSLAAAEANTRAFAAKALRVGAGAGEAAALFREITSLHPDMTALPAESLRGRARYGAACLATVSILRSISAAHVVAAALAALGEGGEAARDDLARALQGQPHRPIRRRALDLLAAAEPRSEQLVAASACLVLLDQSLQAATALAAMRDGRPPASVPRVVLWRSRRAACRTGLRAGLALAISTLALSLLNWPASTTALVQIATLIGLSSTSPNPKGFATGALLGVPLAIAAAGVTEFLVLDGVDQFPLLALGMGPVIVAASLLLAAGRPTLFGIGFLLLVFFTVILSPANPQSYNPQVFLFVSFLSLLAAVALFLLLSTLLPTSDARRRRWILDSARADLRDALAGRGWRIEAPACAFRDADRVGQFASLSGLRDRDGDLRHLLRMSTLGACARRIRTELDPAPRASVGEVLAALAASDPGRLRELGRAMLLASHVQPDHVEPDDAGSDDSAPKRRRGIQHRVAIDLLLAAALIEHSPDIPAGGGGRLAP